MSESNHFFAAMNTLIFLFLLFIFGAINLLLGLAWNFGRQRTTGIYSQKYKTIWIIGVIEIMMSLSFIYLSS
jgi:hypothetical protein